MNKSRKYDVSDEFLEKLRKATENDSRGLSERREGGSKPVVPAALDDNSLDSEVEVEEVDIEEILDIDMEDLAETSIDWISL